jgi:hypothetical protein
MPLQNARVSNVVSKLRDRVQKKGEAGIVYSVILDETHRQIVELGGDVSLIGCIEFRLTTDISADEESLQVAYPFDTTNTNLPVRNETVEISKNSGKFFYKRISTGITPNITGATDTISNLFETTKEKTKNAKEYQKVQKTNIQRKNTNDNNKFDGYGDYYEPQTGIHKLKLYEGDKIIESSFGQSIRFSAYNNSSNVFSPTTIIRNGESGTSRETDINSLTEEDVNRDGSIIVLSSNQYQLPFQPGTVNSNGTSDFETSPQSFQAYPSDLRGDQVLINSGRVIFSAKTAEMIFYSKKDYGFISDGGLSVDNKFGINVNVGDNINITTNDRNVNINSGNGSINLGSTELEPLVKGDTLLSLLEELIDAITDQKYLTPSGPTAGPGPTGFGPTNSPKFLSIKSRLKTILSQLNTTS